VGLIEKLQAPPSSRPSRGSRIDVWAATLPDDERQAVYEAAKNPDWGHVPLLNTLLEAGMPSISASSLQTWRHNNGLPRRA